MAAAAPAVIAALVERRTLYRLEKLLISSLVEGRLRETFSPQCGPTGLSAAAHLRRALRAGQQYLACRAPLWYGRDRRAHTPSQPRCRGFAVQVDQRVQSPPEHLHCGPISEGLFPGRDRISLRPLPRRSRADKAAERQHSQHSK